LALINFKSIGKEYAGTWVLNNVSFEINAGQKIGLIGANGAGKTTLLKLLTSLEKPNEGHIESASKLRIGYVPQYVEFDLDETVLDCLLNEHRILEQSLRKHEDALATATDSQTEKAMDRYQEMRDQYDREGGDLFESKAIAMVEALGLADKTAQPVSLLSGGEKNVLALTKALLKDPNLLILDEPGNHLDYIGLAWLDDFLKRFSGAILIVSHNRYLLDQVVDTVYELEHGKLASYPGNYTQYKHIKQERLEAQIHAYKAYEEKLASMTALVQSIRDIAQGRASDKMWGKRLNSRQTQLDRLVAEAPPKPITHSRKVNIRFQTDVSQATVALQVINYSKAFDDNVLLKDANWEIGGSQRWALIGANGTGKTTLLKDILSLGDWAHPVIRVGPSMQIGYCSQNQEMLNPDRTVYDEIMHVPDVQKEECLALLASFLFTDEDILKKVKNLSGGEKNRLQLARLMLLKPNFLILDEPTNHLDIHTCEAIENALSNFKGTILAVSHDRYFLDKIADHVAEIKDKQLQPFIGNYTQFWKSRTEETANITGRIASRGIVRKEESDKKDKKGGKAWLDRKAEVAQERKTKKLIEQLEKKISAAESEKETMEAKVADAFSSGNHELGTTLSQQLETISSTLEDLYAQWMAYS